MFNLKSYKSIFFIISLNFNINTYSQNIPEEYLDIIKQAEFMYKSKKFCESGAEYNKAFKVLKGGYPDDRFNAARSYAKCGTIDSSFVNLKKLVYKGKFSDLFKLSNEMDFIELYKDFRWNEIVTQTKLNRYEGLKTYNLGLIKKIDSIIIEDQKWRKRGTYYDNTHDVRSFDEIERFKITRNISVTDSLNYFVLLKIINEHGYPNYDLVGEETSNNFWALVQHQDKHIKFQDSILILLKKEVDRNKASKSNYAYLVDRVLVNKNKKQIYGTQMRINRKTNSYEPHPVKNRKNLNKRRATMGLISEQEYIKTMNSKYFGSLQK
jgi:hypothetical protein